MDQPNLTVLIPVYNEENNIKNTVFTVSKKLTELRCSFEILIVDDASTDNTIAAIEEIIKTEPNIRLIKHQKNLGPGSGLHTGIQKSRGKFIIFIPADLAMDVRYLKNYLQAAQNSDIVVGLRSNRKDYSALRKIISIANIMIIKLLFLMPEKQFNYLSMYRKSIFDHFKVESKSVFITAEIMIKARTLNFTLTQIKVDYVARVFGKGSGATFQVILKTVRDMFAVWIQWVIVRRIRHYSMSFKRLFNFNSL